MLTLSKLSLVEGGGDTGAFLLLLLLALPLPVLLSRPPASGSGACLSFLCAFLACVFPISA